MSFTLSDQPLNLDISCPRPTAPLFLCPSILYLPTPLLCPRPYTPSPYPLSKPPFLFILPFLSTPPIVHTVQKMNALLPKKWLLFHPFLDDGYLLRVIEILSIVSSKNRSAPGRLFVVVPPPSSFPSLFLQSVSKSFLLLLLLMMAKNEQVTKGKQQEIRPSVRPSVFAHVRVKTKRKKQQKYRLTSTIPTHMHTSSLHH